jgi:hypothetical protein
MDDFRIIMKIIWFHFLKKQWEKEEINIIYIGVMTILQPSSREFEVRPLRLQCRILSIEL